MHQIHGTRSWVTAITDKEDLTASRLVGSHDSSGRALSEPAARQDCALGRKEGPPFENSPGRPAPGTPRRVLGDDTASWVTAIAGPEDLTLDRLDLGRLARSRAGG